MAVGHPCYGTDVKLMIVRHGQDVHVTACVPQIAALTPDLDAYAGRRAQARQVIAELAAGLAPGCWGDVADNTRDDDERLELYLTAIGSSIESGDEGVVGRGNRANGLISMLRPMSMEGVSGKNPVYHVGKLYNLAAQRAAGELHQLTGRTFTVALVSQSGRDLEDPWQVIAHASGNGTVDEALVRQVVVGVMGDLDDIRAGLLAGKVATA
ncbi:MAG: methionine adenosyltransferase [Trebonia sp.]